MEQLVKLAVQLVVAGIQFVGAVATLVVGAMVAGSQFFFGLATLLLAAVAIWRDVIASWLGLGPELRVHLRNPLGETMPLRSDDGTSTPSRYYHLQVTNKNRWARANHVRVEVIDMLRPGPDGRFTSSRMVDGVPLWWRYANWRPAQVVVGPPAVCDLVQVRASTVVVLQVQYCPSNFNSVLNAGEKMIVGLRARSDEVDSEPLFVEITWDGQFSDNEATMANHLVVRQVSPVADGQLGSVTDANETHPT